MTSKNSRHLAQTWPFARYKSYEGSLRKAAAQWFVNKGYNTDPRMNYCLDSHDLWPKNIISALSPVITSSSERCCLPLPIKEPSSCCTMNGIQPS